MKIAFFETKSWEKRYLQKSLKGHELVFEEEPLSAENISMARQAEVLSTFIDSKITKEIIAKLPRLKLVTTRTTGFDHIDLKACRARNIAVCNVPYYGENTVAEHTFALMLSLSRNIHKAYLRTTRENYEIEGLEGFDLKGKTLGVIGAGHIGLHVIKIAKAFGMEVLAYDIHQQKFVAEILGFQYAQLEDVLKKSDIITLHAPYNKHTHHLINKETIKKIKKGALLINTARGAIIETEALLEALDKGILAGAGLDVLEGEALIREERQLLYDPKKAASMVQLVKDHILLSKENVVFTPHIAFYSREALMRILEETVENIQMFIVEQSQNVVA